jgi:hypothetical protein
MHRNLKARIHAAASFLGSWTGNNNNNRNLPSNSQGQLSTRGGEGGGSCRISTARGRFDIWAAFAPNVPPYSAEHLFPSNCSWASSQAASCCVSSTTNNNSLSPSLLVYCMYCTYLRPFLCHIVSSSSSSSSSRPTCSWSLRLIRSLHPSIHLGKQPPHRRFLPPALTAAKSTSTSTQPDLSIAKILHVAAPS